MTIKEYVTLSLDLNLFFLRIMKEHSFFLEIGFTPKDSKSASEASDFRIEFERLLAEATSLANGYVSSNTVDSGQFVTQFTLEAEKFTSFYSGVKIDTNITRVESMFGQGDAIPTREIAGHVQILNDKAYQLTSELAKYKENLLENVRKCRMFTVNYPLLIDHILREAKFFMNMLVSLNKGDTMMRPEDLLNQEVFWNRIMALALCLPISQQPFLHARQF